MFVIYWFWNSALCADRDHINAYVCVRCGAVVRACIYGGSYMGGSYGGSYAEYWDSDKCADTRIVTPRRASTCSRFSPSAHCFAHLLCLHMCVCVYDVQHRRGFADGAYSSCHVFGAYTIYTCMFVLCAISSWAAQQWPRTNGGAHP